MSLIWSGFERHDFADLMWTCAGCGCTHEGLPQVTVSDGWMIQEYCAECAAAGRTSNPRNYWFDSRNPESKSGQVFGVPPSPVAAPARSFEEGNWLRRWDRHWSLALATWLAVCAIAGIVAGLLLPKEDPLPAVHHGSGQYMESPEYAPSHWWQA